jgi:cytochrome c553
MRLFALLFFIASFAVSANAADSTNGGLLHAEKCTSCHESAVYIRENRIVQSLSGLGTQYVSVKTTWG